MPAQWRLPPAVWSSRSMRELLHIRMPQCLARDLCDVAAAAGISSAAAVERCLRAYRKHQPQTVCTPSGGRSGCVWSGMVERHLSDGLTQQQMRDAIAWRLAQVDRRRVAPVAIEEEDRGIRYEEVGNGNA